MVDLNIVQMRGAGRRRPYVQVQCPRCQTKRWTEKSWVVSRQSWGMFSGECTKCTRRPLRVRKDQA